MEQTVIKQSTLLKSDTIHDYHMRVQLKLVREMAEMIQDTEYSEEERLAYTQAMSEALYVMTLEEGAVNGR